MAHQRVIRIGLGAKLIVAAGALVVALGLCEVAARIVYEAPPYPARDPQIMYQSDPELGFLHVPNQKGWLDDGLATINALGLRGELPVTPKPKDEFRVLAIGDSTTFGWGVGDTETYSAQLEKLLRVKFPGRRLSVVNGGVGAYDLERAAGLLRHFAPSLRPDMVLVGVYWNDLPYERMSPDGVPQGAPPASPTSVAPAASGPSKPFHIGNQPSRLNLILRSSRALYVLRQAWLSALAPTTVATNLVQWEMALLEGRETPAIDAGWKDIESTLGEIRAFGEAGGFPVGVVIIPIRAQVEASYPAAAYQTRVRRIAESLGMFVVDPLQHLIEQPDHKGLFIPYDRMHLSALGNAQIARAAFEVLESRPEVSTVSHTANREAQ